MKKVSKLMCSLVLTAAVLAGTVLSGCAESTNYTEEIRQYQAKLEALEAENQELRAQLGLVETESAAQAETLETAETGTEATQSAAESAEAVQEETQTPEAESQTQAETESQTQQQEEDLTRILVLGDSIWANYRDETGVAARVEYYMEKIGRPAKVYNAAIGGTRATIDPEDNEWQYAPASDNNLGKMTSILKGETDVSLLEGKAAYEEMKAAMEVREDIDYVIVAYGMNDFLSQVPLNDSDRPWIGFGTALQKGIGDAKDGCQNAEVLVIAPSYASYFPIPVVNMGAQALYNYASVACDAAKNENTLCVDAYNNMGIDAYNADDYLEDGVHLNERGRDLYARHVVSCLMNGVRGQVSGNRIYDFDGTEE